MKERTIKYVGTGSFEFSIKYSDKSANQPVAVLDHHIHDECEIYINLSGDVSFVVENRIYPIEKGNVIITRPHEYHHCVYNSMAVHRHFWILFGADGNETLFDLFYERILGENNLIVLSEKQFEDVCAICFEMIDSNKTPAQSYCDFFKLISILENAAGTNVRANDVFTLEMEKALKFIGDNLSAPFRITDVANAAHISVNTLERQFYDVLRTTPSGYIKKRRLARAAELLPYSKSVGETAEMCGFSDYSNFICLFRKKFGITPLKYKKIHALKSEEKRE